MTSDNAILPWPLTTCYYRPQSKDFPILWLPVLVLLNWMYLFLETLTRFQWPAHMEARMCACVLVFLKC